MENKEELKKENNVEEKKDDILDENGVIMCAINLIAAIIGSVIGLAIPLIVVGFLWWLVL